MRFARVTRSPLRIGGSQWRGSCRRPDDAGVYVDSSAVAKLYVPEAESERLDAFLQGRRGLILSDLVITEVLSAVARRKREGGLRQNRARDTEPSHN